MSRAAILVATLLLLVLATLAHCETSNASLEECRKIHADQAPQVLNAIDGVMYYFVDSRNSPTITFFLQQLQHEQNRLRKNQNSNSAPINTIPEGVEHFIFVQVLNDEAALKVPKYIGNCPTVVHHVPATVGGAAGVRCVKKKRNKQKNTFLIVGIYLRYLLTFTNSTWKKH